MTSSLKTLRLSHFLNFLSSVMHVSVPSVSSSLHLYSILLQSQCNCWDEELAFSLMLVIIEREAERKLWTGIIHTAVLWILSTGIYCCFNLLQHSDYLCISYFYFKDSIFWCLLNRASLCDSWRIKNQLDVICYIYFTSWIINMFRTLICPSSGVCD